MEETPGWLARARKRWPMGAYYGSLIKNTPVHLLKAAERTDRIVTVLVLLLGFIVGAAVAWLQQNALWLVVALVIAGFLRSNYQEVDARDRRIKRLTSDVVAYQAEKYFDPFHYRMLAELVSAEPTGQLWGYHRLVERLDRGQATQAEGYAEFDQWEERVASQIALIDKAEVEFFRRALDPATVDGDWRDRLRTLLEVRKSRVEAIHVRQKLRNDSRVAERRKMEAAERAANPQ
jgi:hypothetical protein